MSVGSEIRNIREFVKCLSKVGTPEAESWVEGFIESVPSWHSYSSLAATEQSVENIAFGISRQITIQLRTLRYRIHKAWRDLAEKGHDFLRQIYRMATEIGLEVDLEVIDVILEPEAER